MALYSRARQALVHGLVALGVRRGDEALVPDFHHGSEVQALLSAGLTCRAYRVGPELWPDEGELDRMVGPRTRVLHLVHYLGLPQDAVRWRAWCDARGLLLVEDAAQAWLADVDGVPVGSHGDLAVFCLYKTVGVPDGAAAVGRVPIPAPVLPGARGERYLLSAAVRAVRPRQAPLPAPGVYDQAADIAVPLLGAAPARVTLALLPGAADRTAAEARRRAWTYLQERLADFVPPAFRALPAGASPFVFPIGVRSPAEALAVLHGSGVTGLDLWRSPHPCLRGQDGATSAWLRQHAVGLPVHQDLTQAELKRLARVARLLEPARPTRPAPCREPVQVD